MQNETAMRTKNTFFRAEPAECGFSSVAKKITVMDDRRNEQG